MLSIKISDKLFSCAVFHQQIQHIDYTMPVTSLPFTSSPITGLINFCGRALIQIDVAEALKLEKKNLDTAKLIIVNTPQGSFALRVDDVLNIINPYQEQQLHLIDIIPTHLKTKQTINLRTNVITQKKQKIPVLLVNTCGKTIALLANNIERIQEKNNLNSLNQNNNTDYLTTVRDQLLPDYSLGQLLELENNDTENIAIIIRGTKNAWALLVHQVIAIETISEVYSSETDNKQLWCVNQKGELCQLIDTNTLKISTKPNQIPRLWYITPQGKIQELLNANQLIDPTDNIKHIQISNIETYKQPLISKAHSNTEGIYISFGLQQYFLPLTIAKRALNYTELPKLTPTRFPNQTARTQRQQRIPCINAAKLLFNQDNQPSQEFIEIRLLNNIHFLLNVDKVILSQTYNKTAQWQIFDFPYPLNIFFDAVYYDEHSKHWILRLMQHIKFSDLSWTIKKSILKAIIGWFNQ